MTDGLTTKAGIVTFILLVQTKFIEIFSAFIALFVIRNNVIPCILVKKVSVKRKLQRMLYVSNVNLLTGMF